MNESSGRDEPMPGLSKAGQGGKRGLGAKSKAGGIAVVILAGVYSLVAPSLNARFGWDLPQIKTDSQGAVSLADSPQRKSQAESANSGAGAATPAAGESTEDLLYGLLREVSADRFLSPAGLQYTPGSAEGHRLEHLRRHTKDDPGRPGSHGVFDGGMEGALKTIDRAYDRAKQGQRTTKQVDDGRTIYTVDMGGRIGFIGGRDGGRKRNPMARRVRMVLEGTRVITAYPM